MITDETKLKNKILRELIGQIDKLKNTHMDDHDSLSYYNGWNNAIQGVKERLNKNLEGIYECLLCYKFFDEDVLFAHFMRAHTDEVVKIVHENSSYLFDKVKDSFARQGNPMV